MDMYKVMRNLENADRTYQDCMEQLERALISLRLNGESLCEIPQEEDTIAMMDVTVKSIKTLQEVMEDIAAVRGCSCRLREAYMKCMDEIAPIKLI